MTAHLWKQDDRNERRVRCLRCGLFFRMSTWEFQQAEDLDWCVDARDMPKSCEEEMVRRVMES